MRYLLSELFYGTVEVDSCPPATSLNTEHRGGVEFLPVLYGASPEATR